MTTEQEILAEYRLVSARANALDDIILGIFEPRLHAALTDEAQTREARQEAGEVVIYSCPQSVARAVLCDTLRQFQKATRAIELEAFLEEIEED